MWRPNNWDALKSGTINGADLEWTGNLDSVIEDAADAMLEGLRKQGIHVPKGEFIRIGRYWPEKQIPHYALPCSITESKAETGGTWIFIPDKEEQCSET